ncbi:hypothetical protein I7I51_00444 [Histoplasma capsulatum]|uniref:Uncharacterized protein n=1 Tax=Ajellomyces capsulatus TaxID=5037 RepID=A0A8A1MA43_AJECA|nr:hypothetical protein I7I51_00444 [Histoplasma capsulatum]
MELIIGGRSSLQLVLGGEQEDEDDNDDNDGSSRPPNSTSGEPLHRVRPRETGIERQRVGVGRADRGLKGERGKGKREEAEEEAEEEAGEIGRSAETRGETAAGKWRDLDGQRRQTQHTGTQPTAYLLPSVVPGWTKDLDDYSSTPSSSQLCFDLCNECEGKGTGGEEEKDRKNECWKYGAKRYHPNKPSITDPLSCMATAKSSLHSTAYSRQLQSVAFPGPSYVYPVPFRAKSQTPYLFDFQSYQFHTLGPGDQLINIPRFFGLIDFHRTTRFDGQHNTQVTTRIQGYAYAFYICLFVKASASISAPVQR